ncbi:hypothetical protein [Arthrobacter sp. NPDC090010]|uniref:hypothetical protein n=1 Tax=Arthrobacter sp. NPDC090010 TaxID=3363942 RepID=UPI00381AA09D
MNDGAPTRLRKPSWKDPRLLLGLLLVLASTSGVVGLVAALDQSVEVYAAKERLPVGQRLAPEDLVRVKVRLGDVEAGYLPVAEMLPGDAVMTSFVDKGQLLPRGSIGAASSLGSKPVPVVVDGVLPEQLSVGERADLWVAAPDERNGYKEPRLVVPAVEVSQLVVPQQSFGVGASRVVVVLVPDSLVSRVLAAQGNRSKISLVWNPLGKG